ncbi:MAG: transglutaminase-like domain-containing protein [Actinomycetota bacterium]
MTLRPKLPVVVSSIATSIVVLLPLASVFDGIGWWIRLSAAVLASAVLTAGVETTRPHRELPWLTLTAAAGAVLWTLIAVRGQDFASNPFGQRVWSQVGNGLVNGWSELLSAGEPTADLQAAETVLGFLLFAGVAVGLHVAVRFASPVGVLATSAMLLWVTAAAALAETDGGAWVGGAVGAFSLIAVAAVSRTGVDRWNLSRALGIAATALLAGLLASAAIALTSPLQREAVDPRQARDTETQIVDVPDLLAEFSARSDDTAAVFDVDRVVGSLDAPLRFRVQTYGEHNGQRFLPLAEYVQVSQLTQPGSTIGGDQVAVDVRIRNLDEPFIPVLDRMIRTDLTNLSWDAETETAISADRPVTFQVTGAIIDIASLQEVVIDRFTADDVYLSLPTALPASFRTTALAAVTGASNDREALDAILGVVSELDRDVTVASGHSLGRLADDLTGRRATSEEQLAALQTLLLRAAGIPARTVVGYVATESTVPGSAIRVWVEVPFTGIGWVSTESVDTLLTARVPVETQATTTTSVPNDEDVAARALPQELGPSTDTFEPDESGGGLSLRDVLWIALGLAACALVSLIAARALRRQARRRAITSDERVLGAWAELVDRLRESGLHPGPTTTVGDVVELTASIEPETRSAAESLAARTAAVLHSPRPSMPHQGAAAWEELETIERLLRSDQGRGFSVRRVADPRVLRARGPIPPLHRDGGRRSHSVSAR